jgi:glycosyltransferase involved in cell wall biosynthesis
MNVAIISLRYAPGNWQHMLSFCSELEKRGNNVDFILADEFKPFVNEEKLKNKVFFAGYSKKMKAIASNMINSIKFISTAKMIASNYNRALFVIWHPLNFYLMALIKHFNNNFNISLWLHEPYKEDKSKYGDKRYNFYITEFIQGLSYNYVDNFVLHSRHALNLFEKYVNPQLKRKSYNVYLVPLQYRNKSEGILDKFERTYFSYIGNVAYAKGFDIFIELIKRIKDCQFNLTTSSEINIDLKPLRNLTVINKIILKDEEIAASLCKSIATVCLYRDSTQSGVIPFSFMCGTPVLVTNLSAFEEYVQDRDNCIVIKDINNFDEIQEGLNYIRSNFKPMHKNCIETFNKFFNDNNFDKYYGWFINKT